MAGFWTQEEIDEAQPAEILLDRPSTSIFGDEEEPLTPDPNANQPSGPFKPPKGKKKTFLIDNLPVPEDDSNSNNSNSNHPHRDLQIFLVKNMKPDPQTHQISTAVKFRYYATGAKFTTVRLLLNQVDTDLYYTLNVTVGSRRVTTDMSGLPPAKYRWRVQAFTDPVTYTSADWTTFYLHGPYCSYATIEE